MVSSRFSIPKMLSILSSVVKLNVQVPGHKVSYLDEPQGQQTRYWKPLVLCLDVDIL